MFLQKLKPVVRKAIEPRIAAKARKMTTQLGTRMKRAVMNLVRKLTEDQEQVMTDEQADFMEQDIKDYFFCNL